MKSLIKLMNKFGAHFSPKNKFNFPLKFTSSETPIGIDYKAGVSAQLKSAVILAGLNSYGATKIIEHHRSRDHTENILLNSKKTIFINNDKQRTIKIFGKNSLNSLKINVPCDPSSAAFFSSSSLALAFSRSTTSCITPLHGSKTSTHSSILRGAKIDLLDAQVGVMMMTRWVAPQSIRRLM